MSLKNQNIDTTIDLKVQAEHIFVLMEDGTGIANQILTFKPMGIGKSIDKAECIDKDIEKKIDMDRNVFEVLRDNKS